MINEYSRKPSHKDIDTILAYIEKCLDPKFQKFLNVCRPVKGKVEIDVAILIALLKATETNEKSENKRDDNDDSKLKTTIAQLDLALEWNRVDVAQKFIFTEELKNKVRFLKNKCKTN